MKKVLRRYADLLGRPGALPAVLAVTAGRLSFAMTGLAVLLLVQERTGSYAVAGGCAAVYSMMLAVSSPLRARTADRRGQTRVLQVTGVLHTITMLVFVAAAQGGAATPVLVALLVFGGFTIPPLGSSMRALWGDLVPDARARAAAYALESVLIELCFVLGPLLVGIFVALASPALAVALAGLLAGGGALALAATGVSRRWTPDPDAAAHTVLGPLVSPGVRVVLGAFFLTGASFGAVEISVAAFADAMAADPGAADTATGVLLSAWAAGSATGGLAYGANDHDGEPGPRYVKLLAMLAVGALLPVLAPNLVALGVLLFLYGLAIAPSGACAMLLLSELAPAGTVTEAFGWTTTGIFLGASVGSAVGGLLVEHVDPRAGFVLTAGCGALALLSATLGRARLTLPLPLPGRALDA